MKTSEQYHETNSIGANCIAISEQEFRQIQLDAMKEGGRLAASLAPSKETLSRNFGDTGEQYIAVIYFRDTILAAVDTWIN